MKVIASNSSSNSTAVLPSTGPYKRRGLSRGGRRTFPALLGVLLSCIIITCVGTFAKYYQQQPSLARMRGGAHSLNVDTIPVVSRQLLQASGNETCENKTTELDFLTQEQRQQGGVLIHIFIAAYLFIAVAIVCDNYFVASLERICEVAHLKPDVAGASFMAAGSSAPELFTSIIGVFFTKNDVGISTIVGSAVFNIICIIALCGLFAGMVVHLTWWPLTRDCGFYTLSVVALVLVMLDNTVHWYEALVFLILYALYLTIMYFNDQIETYLQRNFRSRSKPYSEVKPLIAKNSDQENPFGEHEDDLKEEKEEFESPMEMPKGKWQRAYWIFMLPISALFFITIPDCRRPGLWRKLFVVTFLISIVWVAGITYVLVWMVGIIGETFEIPTTVMGLTLLAAGTSIPDAVSSVIVARDGLGDMAVSNGVGSNVFDILICLGLPWFLQTAILEPNSSVAIQSNGLLVSAITLMSTVVCIFVSVMVNKWRLTRKLGVFFFLVYIVIISFMCLYEMNVFSEVNTILPPC